MSLLAVDYGLAKIGLAISEGVLATPLPILKVKDAQDAKQKLLTLLDEHEVETLIFGIPSPDSIKANAFADSLKEQSNIQLIKVDETMTSKQAREKIAEKNKNEDSFVAAILLQEFLDRPEGEKNAI